MKRPSLNGQLSFFDGFSVCECVCVFFLQLKCPHHMIQLCTKPAKPAPSHSYTAIYHTHWHSNFWYYVTAQSRGSSIQLLFSAVATR